MPEQIEVLDEIKSLLMPLSEDELRLLEESVRKEGIRDPLVVWEKDGRLVLVDGFHRYVLAQKYGLEFKVVKRQFANMDEVKCWVYLNQLGRRNLTDAQRTYILGKLYQMMKLDRGRPSEEKRENFSRLPSSDGHATAEAIASLAKVSERTVRLASDFAEAVDKVRELNPKAAERILLNEVKDAKTLLPKIVDNPDLPLILSKVEKLSRLADALKEVEIEREREKAQNTPPDFDLRCGDFEEVLKDVKQVDAIVTDPPWGGEYIDLWDRLGRFAKEKLKPHGFLIAYSGQHKLDEKIKALSNHLDYYWLFCKPFTVNKQPKLIQAVNIMNSWELVLIYQNGFKRLDKAVKDLVEDRGMEKDFYEWQRETYPTQKLIEIFTEPGDLVCDPFFGSGTTAVACKLMKRRFVGAESDPKLVEIAKARLRE
jgi:hypothetical protein